MPDLPEPEPDDDDRARSSNPRLPGLIVILALLGALLWIALCVAILR